LAAPFQRWGGVFVCGIEFSGGEMEQDDPLKGEGGDAARAENAGHASGAVDWDTIKHAVLYSGLSYRRISDRHGSCEKTIGNKARKEGWVRVVPLQPLPCGRRARPPGAPRPKRETADQIRRRQMVRRLFEVLDTKLREIEERMADARAEGTAPQSAADSERDARSLTALARLYAKLVELDDAAKTAGEGSDKGAATRSDDADQLRRDLALRLERLNRAGDA
jgi:hypothetical protein